MGVFEDAVIYATKMHNGKVRKATGTPAILHSMEVANIISTITTNVDVMVAGLLHDVVEDTDGSIEEIRNLFGDRVAEIVLLETENKYEGVDKSASWKVRKEESIKKLRAANDIDAEILWLADKLSNIRSLASSYSELGEKTWEMFNQKDPDMHLWYYRTIGETLEMHLNRTGAFKEYIKHINFIWPGTFASDKTKFKKYREVSLEGCKLVGKGAKAEVYRYDDEFVIKLYNEDNEYKDIEREYTLSKIAFVAGIPTVIPFGIVKVGKRYGTMFELLRSKPISLLIAADKKNLKKYADIMAELAHQVHSTKLSEKATMVPYYSERVHSWIDEGIAYEDKEVADKIRRMVDALPKERTLIHGDFHAGNVIVQAGEYMLIDMDCLSIGHPVMELSSAYMAYKAFWEVETPLVEKYMPFSTKVGEELLDLFMKAYLDTDDIEAVVNKAALLCYVRLVRKCYKKGLDSTEDIMRTKEYYVGKIRELIQVVNSLEI